MKQKMNKILVIATAARAGGALSILKKVISEAKNTKNKYTFLVDPSIEPTLDKAVNIEYIGINTKKWLNRIYIDFSGCSRFIKKSNYSICLNLQNIPIRIKNVKQYIYYHQPLPLVNEKMFRKDKKLWLYQKFYLFFVRINIQYVHKFIVQTDWIQNKLSEKLPFPRENIKVLKYNIDTKKELSTEKLYDKNKNILFYPADSYFYKNHNLLINALSIIPISFLKRHNYLLYLTITEYEYITTYKQKVPDYLKEFIIFLGRIDYKKVHYYYSISKALLFPSYIETLGLPLIEATSHGCFIIASDLEYSTETLHSYSNKNLCPSDNPRIWAEKIMLLIDEDKIDYTDNTFNSHENIIDFVINNNEG